MNLDEILKDAEREFAAAANLPILDQVKARYLGKSGAITEQMKGLGSLPADQRKLVGARINQIKDQVEALLKSRRDAIQSEELERQLAAESLDVTLPGRGEGMGGLHPVSRTLARIEQLFASIGFSVADGPEIEIPVADGAEWLRRGEAVVAVAFTLDPLQRLVRSNRESHAQRPRLPGAERAQGRHHG